MTRGVFVALALLSAAAVAGEAPRPSIDEQTVRLQAAIQEVVAQRDAAQARAANQAGDLAMDRLRIRALEAELAKASSRENEKEKQ